MAPKPILIAGAGPTGLVLALSLAHRGVAFRLIDKNAGPGEASRAMAVQARTLEFYRQLGFAEEVVAQGMEIERVHLRKHGEDVAVIDLSVPGVGVSPYPFVLSYPQDEHERFLGEKLAAMGCAIEWNVALKEFTDEGGQVCAVLDHGGRTEFAEFSYVCGCDGARSVVREALGVGFPGGTYDHEFFVADTRVEGNVGDDLYGNLSESDFCLMLPIRSNGAKRLIGTIPGEVTAGGGEMTFERLRPFVERLLGVRVTQVNWFSTYRVHHRVAAGFRVGRAFLAGDAGHIHSPVGGQGMNTGIGDAINLAWKLADVVQGRAGESILDTYESERIAFARTLVKTTDRVFTVVSNRGWGGSLFRGFFMPTVAPWLTKAARVRQGMFGMVSQTRIHYPDSPLSEGEAGRVKGGDRLPWVHMDGADNFDPLKSLGWQVHVYGELEEEFAAAVRRCGLQLEAFAWSDVAEAVGLLPRAFYLVRPDGYVALAEEQQSAAKLTDYCSRHELRFKA